MTDARCKDSFFSHQFKQPFTKSIRFHLSHRIDNFWTASIFDVLRESLERLRRF